MPSHFRPPFSPHIFQSEIPTRIFIIAKYLVPWCPLSNQYSLNSKLVLPMILVLTIPTGSFQKVNLYLHSVILVKMFCKFSHGEKRFNIILQGIEGIFLGLKLHRSLPQARIIHWQSSPFMIKNFLNKTQDLLLQRRSFESRFSAHETKKNAFHTSLPKCLPDLKQNASQEKSSSYGLVFHGLSCGVIHFVASDTKKANASIENCF